MGTDINAYAERRLGGIWRATGTRVFQCRNSTLFGLLSDNRVFGSDCDYRVTRPSPRGIPTDVSLEVQQILLKKGFEPPHPVSQHRGCDWSHPSPGVFCATWWTIDELLGINYARPSTSGNGVTLGTALGPDFFLDINRLLAEHAERLIIWFDN